MGEALARWSGPLALIAGAVFIGFIVLLSAGVGWYAYPLVFVLLGAAAAGVAARHWSALTMLGRASAGLSVIGATLVLVLWMVGPALGLAAADSLWWIFLIAFLAFLVGNVGLAVAIFAAHRAGAALLGAGALIGVILLFFGGEDPSPLVILPVLLFGAGWVLIGWDLRAGRPTARAEM